MDTRCMLVAPLALAIAGAAAAAPITADSKAAEPVASRPATVVLASADQVVVPTQTPEAQPATPAKRPRAARVTSCRCAGQVSPPDRADQ